MARISPENKVALDAYKSAVAGNNPMYPRGADGKPIPLEGPPNLKGTLASIAVLGCFPAAIIFGTGIAVWKILGPTITQILSNIK